MLTILATLDTARSTAQSCCMRPRAGSARAASEDLVSKEEGVPGMGPARDPGIGAPSFSRMGTRPRPAGITCRLEHPHDEPHQANHRQV